MRVNLNHKDDFKSRRNFHSVHFFLYLIDKMYRKIYLLTWKHFLQGLAITLVSDESDAKILNDVQERFDVNITELPDEIDLASYSK